MSSFGVLIKTERLNKDLSLRDLAGLTGLDHSYIGRLEKGGPTPSRETVFKLAEALNIPKDILLAEAGYAPTPEDKLNEEQETKVDKNKISSLVRELKKYLREDEITLRNPLMALLLPFLASGPGVNTANPRVELADLLESNNIEITEGGEIITPEKRNRLVNALRNTIDTIRTLTIPLLGTIRAGIPLLSEQNIIDHIEITLELEGKVDFALAVRGDSMVGAGIHDGDIVLCKKTTEPRNGQVIVALVNDDETTLKFYIRENGKELLRAANPRFEDIQLKTGDVIQGYVVRVQKEEPDLNFYRDYIYYKEEYFESWNPVLEKAVANGIKPSVIEQILDMQIEMAKKLAGK